MVEDIATPIKETEYRRVFTVAEQVVGGLRKTQLKLSESTVGLITSLKENQTSPEILTGFGLKLVRKDGSGSNFVFYIQDTNPDNDQYSGSVVFDEHGMRIDFGVTYMSGKEFGRERYTTDQTVLSLENTLEDNVSRGSISQIRKETFVATRSGVNNVESSVVKSAEFTVVGSNFSLGEIKVDRQTEGATASINTD